MPRSCQEPNPPYCIRLQLPVGPYISSCTGGCYINTITTRQNYRGFSAPLSFISYRHLSSASRKSNQTSIMTASKAPLRKRLSNRLSFRQSDPDISESYHHRLATTGDGSNNTANNRRRLLALRRNSFRLSFSLDASDKDKNDAAPTAVDSETQALAVKACVFLKTSFHESLPPSLLEAYEMRDCVAPFQREEVSMNYTRRGDTRVTCLACIHVRNAHALKFCCLIPYCALLPIDCLWTKARWRWILERIRSQIPSASFSERLEWWGTWSEAIYERVREVP